MRRGPVRGAELASSGGSPVGSDKPKEAVTHESRPGHLGPIIHRGDCLAPGRTREHGLTSSRPIPGPVAADKGLFSGLVTGQSSVFLHDLAVVHLYIQSLTPRGTFSRATPPFDTVPATRGMKLRLYLARLVG